MSNLSPSTLALLRAAKNDAPSKESRNAIWGGVTSGLVTHTPLHITPQGASAAPPPMAASTAPAAVATKGLATAAGLTGMKGAFIGALFGSAISIGVATFMLRTKPVPTPQNEIPRAPLSAQVATQVAQSSGAANAPATANQNAATNSNAANPNATNMVSATTPTTEIDALPISTNAGSSQNSVGSATSKGNAAHAATSMTDSSSTDDTASHATKKKSTTSGDQNISPDDMLLRESSLIAEARRDLRMGDAAAALKAARAARSLEARQMEPEEMDVEAQALRALGRDTEATKIEAQRRTMYPNAL